jgi:NAD(P)-dependent dehydrogenase (short-subunit alcohol dehydrogenase family)
MKLLDGRVMVVTGGASGMGAATVRLCVAAGALVYFGDIQDERGADLAASVGPAATFVHCDVTDEADVAGLVDRAVAATGRLDCLVNNAGWHPPHKPIDEFSYQEFRDLFELNMMSMFAACKRALPHLRRVRGNIINISSLVGIMGQLHAATYVATKGAITAFTKALAVDEAAHDVRVNAISPGNVYTPLWQEAIDAAPDPARCRADGEAAQVLGRMGTIEETGALCLFIAAEATFTTGVDHIQSGGAELAYGRKTRKA